MTNEAVFPFPDGMPYYGLTKRDLFAAMAMQGILAGSDEARPVDEAKAAVAWADALIAELNRKEGDAPK